MPKLAVWIIGLGVFLVITAFLAFYRGAFNQIGSRAAEYLLEQDDEQIVPGSRFKPQLDCNLIKADPDDISFRVTNLSSSEFVVRAKLRIDDEPIECKFWNGDDLRSFLDGEEITTEQITKSPHLYPQLPLAISSEAGGVWATKLTPGETKRFSTTPFLHQREFRNEWATSWQNKIQAEGFTIDECEDSLGLELTPENRLPNLLKDTNLDSFERLELEFTDPREIESRTFERGKDFNWTA